MLRPPGTPPCGSQLTEIFGKTVTGQHCEATLVKHSNGDYDIVYETPGGQNQRIFSNAGFAASQWVPILPARTAVPQFGLPWPRFRSPRIEPDVRISRTHPTITPAGSNRSSHGGDEMAEAFEIACHELVSLDFRCGSIAAVSEARFVTNQAVLYGPTTFVAVRRFHPLHRDRSN